jgi:nicotinamidase-related amidase
MALSSLDDRAALIVIDLQKGTRDLPIACPMEGVVTNTAKLIRSFRTRGWPVVLVTVAGKPSGRTEMDTWASTDLPDDWAELLQELDPHVDDHLMTKQARSAFEGTDLHSYLQQSGVTQLFLTGVVTSGGVESTARSAYDQGYNVVLITDAMSDTSEASHTHCVEVVFPRLGFVTKLPVLAHTTDIDHVHPRLPGNVCADVPGVRIREQGCVRHLLY